MRAVRLVFHASRHWVPIVTGGLLVPFAPSFLPFPCSLPPRTEIGIYRWKKFMDPSVSWILFHTGLQFFHGNPKHVDRGYPVPSARLFFRANNWGGCIELLQRFFVAVGCFAAGLSFIPRCFAKGEASRSVAGINRPRASDLCKV